MPAVDRVYAAAATVAFAVVHEAARLGGASRSELAARSGKLPDAPSPLYWFHGASAGEVAAAVRLSRLLHESGRRFTPAFTAANRAGVEAAGRLAEAGTVAAPAPWDSPRAVARAFDRWRPSALFLVETEIWPRLIFEADRRGVPVFCVSARIYPRDVSRYGAVRRWLAPTFGRLTAVLAQDSRERERFVGLGVPDERCVVAGNLKHVDHPAAARNGSDEMARAEDLVVFGSLHEDEIALAFAALDELPAAGWRAVIAPRHASAGGKALHEAGRRGWSIARRSEGARGDWRVLLLDTMGELPRFYGQAAAAVVGGGFRAHGGHNLVEPVRSGAPVLFGPHCDHFEPEARALEAAAPESVVRDAAELGRRLRDWLADAGRRREALGRQRSALPDGNEIANRYRILLSRWL